MTAIAIYAGRILTPQEELLDNVIVVEGGRITAIGHRDEVHIPPGAKDYVASGMTVVPGFVDVHIHGAGGHDVMEATPEALDAITSTVARFGTTSIVATTVTCTGRRHLPQPGRHRAIRSQPRKGGREYAGWRPKLWESIWKGRSSIKARRGVHPADSIAQPSIEMLEKFRAAADGLVKIVTVAPEIPGALELIAKAVADGLVVAMGHTDADYDQARAAIKAGARHAVHVYNAMRPFTHRDPGVISAILTDTEVTAEIIADGVHVAGPAIQVLRGDQGIRHGAAGERRHVCHRDARRKLPPGKFRGDGEGWRVPKLRRQTGGQHADARSRAALHGANWACRLWMRVRMATILPARRLGLAGKKGILAIGGDADLVVLTPDLHVAGVMTRGVGINVTKSCLIYLFSGIFSSSASL